MNAVGARSLAATLALSCLLLCGCGKPPSKDECNALLDHYVELLVNSDRPGTSAGELHKLQLQAREKANGKCDASGTCEVEPDPEFSTCSDHVSRRMFDCAMSAPNADVLEQCLL